MCVYIHAAKRGTKFEALEPLRQGIRDYFGGFAPRAAQGLALRHDEEIAFLGITSSPAFVRAPEGNGGAERFVRILKENLLWVRDFATVEELRLALIDFKHTYNENWIIHSNPTGNP